MRWIKRLIDKSTAKLLKVNGKPVTASKPFTAETADGTVNLEFTFDSSGSAGKSTVVFESLKYKEKEIAIHADISDEGQTVEFEETPKPPTDTPKTGDDFPIWPVIALAAATAAAALVLKLRRKADDDKSDE